MEQVFYWIFIAVVCVFVFFILLMLIDAIPLEIRKYTVEATVHSLVYGPDSQRTSVAPGVSTGGGFMVAMVATGTEESFNVLLSNGKAIYTTNNPELFAKAKVGDPVSIRMKCKRSALGWGSEKVLGVDLK